MTMPNHTHCTTLPHLQYSPDLAPSGYHLFGATKESLSGKHYGNDEEVNTAVRNLLRKQKTKFYKARIHTLIPRWNTAIERSGNYHEKQQCDPLEHSLILM